MFVLIKQLETYYIYEVPKISLRLKDPTLKDLLPNKMK